jgi:FtsZ-binding cell division protein ZapB
MMIGELQRELVDTKEKLKSMTAKFTAVRKERDQLKTETKDLQ